MDIDLIDLISAVAHARETLDADPLCPCARIEFEETIEDARNTVRALINAGDWDTALELAEATGL